MRTIGGARWAVLILAAALVETTGADDNPFSFFEPTVRVTPAERQRIERGEVVARVVAAQGRELAIFATSTINVSGDLLVSRVRDIAALRRGRFVQAINRFSDPPALQDLSRLTLDEGDLEGIRGCRPGDCSLKLSAKEIERLQRRIADEGARWKNAVQQELRHIVLERVQAYLERGHRGVPDYHDDPTPRSPAALFSSLLQHSRFLHSRIPALPSYLEQYPGSTLPGVESFLYWDKTSFGRKPVVAVTHVNIVRGQPGSGIPDVVIASKQLFATHYTNCALTVTALLPRSGGATSAPTPGGNPPAYLAYLYRSSVDFSGWLRPFVERRVKNEVAQVFAGMRQRIEQH